jgi:two-component system, OmpR family, sensor kinase
MSKRTAARADDVTEPVDVPGAPDEDTATVPVPRRPEPDPATSDDEQPARPMLATTRRSLPLAFRLVATFVLLFAAALLVVAGITIRLTRDHLSGELDDRLTAAVDSFQSGPAQRIATPDDLAGQARAWLAAEAVPNDQVVAVRTASGDVLTSTGGLDLQGVEPSADLLMARRSKWWDVDSRRDGAVRALTVPIVLNGQRAGTIVAAASRSPVDETLGSLQSSVAWASGIGLVLAALLALGAVRRTLGPLSRMTRDVNSIESSGDLSRRVVQNGPADEVGRLGAAFNHMLGTVEDGFRSQQRFVSDASHELRTPLTVARGQLELLSHELESARAREELGAAVDELDRMGRIVDDLLLLARLDEGLPLSRERVEIELVLEEALLRGTLVARRDMRSGVEPEVYVLADPDRLLQVVTNLVTNAVEHAGEDASIRLTARRADGRGVIEVADTGPGIAPDDVPHVFERFYRGTNQDAGDGGSGTGLGLAIAASLTRAMDGEITVESKAGAGTTFVVSMPLAPPNA